MSQPDDKFTDSERALADPLRLIAARHMASRGFALRLPEAKCGLHLSHNAHRQDYETAAQHLARYADLYEFKDAAARQRCIDTGELWTLQWYPETPVGRHTVAAPTLAELLEFANEHARA